MLDFSLSPIALGGSDNISLLEPNKFEPIDSHNKVRNKVHRSI